MDEQQSQKETKGNQVAASAGNSKKKVELRRHLDHLPDLTNGACFTPLPEPLRSAWFDKKITDAKMRFIMVMLGHSADFHVRQNYLRKRFHPSSIRKYTRELLEDGVLRVDRVKKGVGIFVNIHHVNPLAQWRLRELAEDKSAILDRSPVNVFTSERDHSRTCSPVNENNETKINQTNPNETNSNNPSGGEWGFSPDHNARAGASEYIEERADPEAAKKESRRLTQFASDHFDGIFTHPRRRGASSCGFDFSEANKAVALVVEQVGYDRAEHFSRYLRAYQRVTNRTHFKPSEIPSLFRRYLLEPDLNQVTRDDRNLGL